MGFTPEQQARIRAAGQAAGVMLSDKQLDAMSTYADLLAEHGKTMNLTAIRDADGVVDKHFIDSLAGDRLFPEAGVILDIGTGAGFPGLVLKIARPERRLILIDGTAKKIAFVNTVITALGLTNISALHQRAEDSGFQFDMAGQMDAVTARAVAPIDELVDLAREFLKPGGRLVLYKGVDEAEAAKPRTWKGFLPCKVDFYELPAGDRRALVSMVRR